MAASYFIGKVGIVPDFEFSDSGSSPPTMASMNSQFATRKNCLVLDVVEAFPGEMVPTQEWVNFLVECLKIDFDVIVSAYIYQKTNLLMVTVNSEEVFETALKSLEQGVMWTKYGKYVFGWSATTVTTPVTDTYSNILCFVYSF